MPIPRPAAGLLFFIAATIWCEGQAACSLKITVTDMSGAVIPRAQVRVLDGREVDVLADQNGSASVDGLQPGTYEVEARSAGFIDARVSGIAVAIGTKREVLLKLEQAPPDFSEIRTDQTLDPHLYNKLLEAFNEPDFCRQRIEGHAQSFRFLWLPTFDHPVFMRVDIKADGTGTLQTKKLSGSGGSEWGKLETSTARKLSFDEEDILFTTLADIGFWTLPANVKDPYEIVLDGTIWLIEGSRDGECHTVARYSSPLTDIFTRYFLGEVGKVQPYYQQVHQ